jgi:hypothetical protein
MECSWISGGAFSLAVSLDKGRPMHPVPDSGCRVLGAGFYIPRIAAPSGCIILESSQAGRNSVFTSRNSPGGRRAEFPEDRSWGQRDDPVFSGFTGWGEALTVGRSYQKKGKTCSNI